VTVTRSTVTNYGKNGITCKDTGTICRVDHDMVTRTGPDPFIAQNGMEIAFGAGGTVSRNTLTGNECDDAAGGCGTRAALGAWRLMACPLPSRGTGALSDLARSCQPRSIDESAITVTTLEPQPGWLGDARCRRGCGPRAGHLPGQHRGGPAEAEPARTAPRVYRAPLSSLQCA
jgi:hypothetical protein